jgi:hypothetical protein
MNEKTKQFFQNLKPFEENSYALIDNDRLIIYAVSLLEKNNIEPTFDKVVVTAFKLFPQRFALIGFPEYPDGKRIHDCLWHCFYKTKRWLEGNAKSGYYLTDKGKKILLETERRLKGEIQVIKEYSAKAKRKEVFFLELLKKSRAYKKFIEGKKDEISNIEILEVLRVSENTKYELVKENLEKYFEYATLLNEENIKNFLKFIKNKLELMRNKK